MFFLQSDNTLVTKSYTIPSKVIYIFANKEHDDIFKAYMEISEFNTILNSMKGNNTPFQISTNQHVSSDTNELYDSVIITFDNYNLESSYELTINYIKCLCNKKNTLLTSKFYSNESKYEEGIFVKVNIQHFSKIHEEIITNFIEIRDLIYIYLKSFDCFLFNFEVNYCFIHFNTYYGAIEFTKKSRICF